MLSYLKNDYEMNKTITLVTVTGKYNFVAHFNNCCYTIAWYVMIIP
ncbi:hypothetical protein SAMN04487934_11072 [Eubacterium ruminantium]|nr:hypothetical protein SAMN04487934_11072 [Eubacterium ruminantium]